MGEGLFAKYPDLVAAADEILGYPVATLCRDDTEGLLNRTEYTQPALYTTNALTYRERVEAGGESRPDFVAGHSLGEYNALLAAGVFDFVTGLKLVQERGRIMSRADGGGMAAIIGLEPLRIAEVLDDAKLDEIDIANYNSPAQTVISGRKSDIDATAPVFERAGVKMYVPLKVSGAFHSRYMIDAKNEFARFAAQFDFGAPKIPVIANYTALPYTTDSVLENLTQQISNSVRWTESVRYLLDRGVTEIEEVGPGAVLSGLIRQIRR